MDTSVQSHCIRGIVDCGLDVNIVGLSNTWKVSIDDSPCASLPLQIPSHLSHILANKSIKAHLRLLRKVPRSMSMVSCMRT